jgi:hypothetical protein
MISQLINDLTARHPENELRWSSRCDRPPKARGAWFSTLAPHRDQGPADSAGRGAQPCQPEELDLSR